MARPPKADADRKSNMLRIRLTEDDRQILDSAADLSGEDTSTWARTVLLRNAKRKSATIVTEWTRRVVEKNSSKSSTE